MKKLLILVSIIIFCCCASSPTIEKKVNQEFLSDLSSENNRLEAELYLDVFDSNLESLTYDYYLTYITKHEAPSAKGFSSIVKTADYHFFKAQKEKFILALLYKEEKVVICDDSHTPFIDTCYQVSEKSSFPELAEFAKKWLK